MKYIFYLGNNGEFAANLFEEGPGELKRKDLKLQFNGKSTAPQTYNSKLARGGGTIIGTKGRKLKPQPANGVFAVIALNSTMKIIQRQADHPAQEIGNGREVSFADTFFHEGVENLEFEKQIQLGVEMNYDVAHWYAVLLEIQTKKELSGFAGSEVDKIVP